MKKYLLLILLGLSITFISCDNDDDKDDNEPGVNYDARTEQIQSNSSDEIYFNLENRCCKNGNCYRLAFSI